MRADLYLAVENPDSKAVIDFLSHGVSLRVSISDGKLTIEARASHGETASTFDIRDWEMILPEYERAK